MLSSRPHDQQSRPRSRSEVWLSPSWVGAIALSVLGVQTVKLRRSRRKRTVTLSVLCLVDLNMDQVLPPKG